MAHTGELQTPQRMPLRIVSFNTVPAAFDIVRQWAERFGHTIVLVVTSPGPKTRRSDDFKQTAARRVSKTSRYSLPHGSRQ